MEAFLVSTFSVAVGEIGDKTQLLSLLLAARFRRPVPIILGILTATLFNHALAGLVGEWVRAALGPDLLKWILGLSFVAIGLWALKPDSVDEGDASRFGGSVFLITVVAFFLAEMGDKTQVATMMLAAKYHDLVAVVAGTTLGMLIADVPAVLLGDRAAPKIPFKLVRSIAAAVFCLIGILVLLGVGGPIQGKV